VLNRPTTIDLRHGFTLLEMMSALTITAVLMASSMVVLRSSYAVWQAHEADLNTASAGNAVLRNIVQTIRQADAITAPDSGGSATSTLTILRADGDTITWDLSLGSVTHQINNDAAQPLANDVTSLSFLAYEADGTTLASTADQAQVIHCEVTANRPSGGTRTVSSFVWLRSW
jgi:prepilin-type N-terminal cleavage/methylation domain-containing protein